MTHSVLISQRQLDELTRRIGRLEEENAVKTDALLVAQGIMEDCAKILDELTSEQAARANAGVDRFLRSVA